MQGRPVTPPRGVEPRRTRNVVYKEEALFTHGSCSLVHFPIHMYSTCTRTSMCSQPKL